MILAISMAQMLTLASPTVIVIGATLAGLRWLWRTIKRDLEQGRERMGERLDRIEKQTTMTNGTVVRHTEQIARLEGAVYRERREGQ